MVTEGVRVFLGRDSGPPIDWGSGPAAPETRRDCRIARGTDPLRAAAGRRCGEDQRWCQVGGIERLGRREVGGEGSGTPTLRWGAGSPPPSPFLVIKEIWS